MVVSVHPHPFQIVNKKHPILQIETYPVVVKQTQGKSCDSEAKYTCVRVQVIMAVSMEMGRAFWDMAPCSLVRLDRRFRDAYCPHHQGDDPDGAVAF
jgi:hypothetical protein